MNVLAIFGLSTLMSLVSSVVAAKIYVWPWLLKRERNQALAALVAPHLFLRFIETAIVPPLLVTHFLVFRLLMGTRETARIGGVVPQTLS